MNILFINNGDIKGGAPRVAYSLKEELTKRGHTASMFVKHKYSSDPDVLRAFWPSLITRLVKRITNKDIGSVLSSRLHRLLATDIEWFNTDKLLETEEFERADIVHCHNLHGNYFKLDTLRKISKLKPVVWTFHDMWPITSHCGHAYGGKEKDGFYECPSLDTYQELSWNNEVHLINVKRKVYTNSRFHIVVPSLWLKEKVVRSVLADKPISLIYNGIDEKVFHPLDKKETRNLLSIPQDKRVVLFASTRGASPEKGGEYFNLAVEYFKKRNDVFFLCIGGNLGEFVASDNVKYIPYIGDMKLLNQYYAASDIFLFTSLAENFPLVVLESMSAGLPVVGFDVGGVKEAVIHKEGGYIAKYRDSNDLLDGVEFILSLDTTRYNNLSLSARNRVLDNFTIDHMFEAYFTLYNKMMDKEMSSLVTAHKTE